MMAGKCESPCFVAEVGPVTATVDAEEFQQSLKESHIFGGGDCPEMAIRAIKMALEISLPSSYVYVFTDARAKDFYLVDDVLRIIQKKQSQVRACDKYLIYRQHHC